MLYKTRAWGFTHASSHAFVSTGNSTGSVLINIFNETHSRPWLPQQTLAFARSEGWWGLGVKRKNSRVDMRVACGSMAQMKELPSWMSSLWRVPAGDCYSAFNVFTLMTMECQIPLSLSRGEITPDRGVILSLITPTLPDDSQHCY